MKISEVIQKLEYIKNNWGDLEVQVHGPFYDPQAGVSPASKIYTAGYLPAYSSVIIE